MRPQRGYTLVEVLVALLILGIVITTTIAMFAQRSRYLRDSNETILVWQVMWNESEVWRRVSWDSLASQSAFSSDTALLKPLEPFETTVKVDPAKDDANIKNVTLTVRWQWDDKEKVYRRDAHLSLLRANTGGSNLW